MPALCERSTVLARQVLLLLVKGVLPAEGVREATTSVSTFTSGVAFMHSITRLAFSHMKTKCVECQDSNLNNNNVSFPSSKQQHYPEIVGSVLILRVR